MAAETWYYNGTTYGSAPAWQVFSNTDPGTENFVSPTTGWTVGTGATNRSKFQTGVLRAATTFDATTYPNGTPDTTTLDCIYVQTFTTTEQYDAGTWTLTFCVRSAVLGGAAGRIHARMFIDTSTTHQGAPVIEVTSGDQVGSIVTLSTTATVDSVVTFTTSTPTVLNNAQLLLQLAWERTTAGGMTTADVQVRQGNASGHGTRFTTPNVGPIPVLPDLIQPPLFPPHYGPIWK